MFTFTAAGSGIGFYLLSQRLAPAVEAMGVDALWLVSALLVGGVMLLWAAITSKSGAPEPEPVAAEG